MTTQRNSDQPFRIAIVDVSGYYSLGLMQLLEKANSNVQVESFKTVEDCLRRHGQLRFHTVLLHLSSKGSIGQIKKMLAATNSKNDTCRLVCYFTEFHFEMFTLLYPKRAKFFFHINDDAGEIMRIITGSGYDGALLSACVMKLYLSRVKEASESVSSCFTFTADELKLLQLLVVVEMGPSLRKKLAPRFKVSSMRIQKAQDCLYNIWSKISA